MNALGILLGSDAYTDCEQIWEVGNALVFAKSRKGFNVSNVEPCPENHTPPRGDPSTLFSLSERGPISPGFNPGLTPGFNIRMEVCPESTSNPLRGGTFRDGTLLRDHAMASRRARGRARSSFGADSRGFRSPSPSDTGERTISFLTKLDSSSSAGACTPKRRPAHTPAR
jgi:hypothetical protein